MKCSQNHLGKYWALGLAHTRPATNVFCCFDMFLWSIRGGPAGLRPGCPWKVQLPRRKPISQAEPVILYDLFSGPLNSEAASSTQHGPSAPVLPTPARDLEPSSPHPLHSPSPKVLGTWRRNTCLLGPQSWADLTPWQPPPHPVPSTRPASPAPLPHP